MSIRECDLLLDEIDARHHLRDRMFYLDAGIHFHEEEVAVLIEEKLDGPDIPVVHSFDGFDGDAADFTAELLVDSGRRRFFEQLLMTALDRAIALAKMHDMPTVVGGNLHFDMAGLEEIAFEVDGIVAERGLRLRLRGLKCTREVFCFVHDTHAATAPTGRGFDDDGVTDLGGGFEGFLFAFELAWATRREQSRSFVTAG